MSKWRQEHMGEEQDFESHYYNLYDEAGRPVLTACLVQRAGIWSRGLALCCDKDFGNLSKKRGRQIAKGRALKAATSGKTFGSYNRKEAMARLDEVDPFCNIDSAKGIYNTDLSSLEMSIIENIQQRKEKVA